VFSNIRELKDFTEPILVCTLQNTVMAMTRMEDICRLSVVYKFQVFYLNANVFWIYCSLGNISYNQNTERSQSTSLTVTIVNKHYTVATANKDSIGIMVTSILDSSSKQMANPRLFKCETYH